MSIPRAQAFTVHLPLVDVSGDANLVAVPQCYVSCDGGAFAGATNAPERLTIPGGQDTHVWRLTLTTEEMDAASVHVLAYAAGCVPVDISLYPEADYTATRASKLDNADVAVSSRLAAADYTAPDNAGIAAAKAAAEATNARLPTNPAQEETVSSRLAAADYVTPPTVVQVRKELDAHSTSLATLMTRLSAERAALLDTLARLDVAVSSRLAASAYTAPDNASIAQAAADAATVASRLTATRAAHLDAPISGIPAAVWSHVKRTLTDLGLTGLGANPVVVHVQDDTGAPLLGQMVTVLDAAGTHVIAVAISDAQGAATLNLPTGEVLLAALSSISHVAPEPVSYEVVPGVQDGPTITLLARFAAVMPEPGLCLVYGRLITGDGKPVVGATARAELRDTEPVVGGKLLSRASVTSEPSDAVGVFRMLLPYNKEYRVLFDDDRQWRDVTVPAAPTLDLGTLPAW